jgi:hypothetical protein
MSLIWFRLFDSSGKQFEGSSATKVLINPPADVDDFREAVKAKLSNRLSFVDADELFVYKNEESFKRRRLAYMGNEEPLEVDFSIVGLGVNKDEDALIVVAPSTTPSIGAYKIESFRINFKACLELSSHSDLFSVGKLITTPAELFGTDLPYGLFVRQEYFTLLDLINSEIQKGETKKRVLILGSPGIGKSIFGIWTLLLAMKERKHVCIKPKENSPFIFLTWRGTKYDFSSLPSPGVIYHGYLDGDENGYISYHNVIKPVYLFSSPRDTNYNEFKKGAITLCMNPWSKGESMILATVLKKEEQCFRMFNLVGGKPRYLFENLGDYDAYVDIVKISIPEDTNELKSHIVQVKRGTFNMRMSHILYLFFRNEREPKRLHITFSSPLIETMMVAKYKLQVVEQLRSFLMTPNMDLQSWRGTMMEQILLEEITTKSFCMRALDFTDRKAVDFEPLSAPSTIIESESEITNELKLFLPISKTFPSIDALLVIPEKQMLIYIQTTVSLVHRIKYQYLDRVYQHLISRVEFKDYSHILLFLVSNDIYDAFETQQYLNQDGSVRKIKIAMNMSQYVGKITNNFRIT